jgi:hypothetical protein
MLARHRLLGPPRHRPPRTYRRGQGALPPEHPATGLQNNLIWKCHPLLDRAAASVHNGGYTR